MGKKREVTIVETEMVVIGAKKLLTDDYKVVEAVKSLRTNILFSGTDIQAIGLTSCDSNDGKTTVALQLAASLAQNGKSVFFLDTDMRKSVLPYRVEHKEAILGLSHFLSGNATLNEVLYHTDEPNLSMIFAGLQPPNPAELLGSERFKNLVQQLKKYYDYIIVDTPPLGRVVDCAIEASLLDGVLIVVNAQNNSIKQIRRVKTQLEKTNGKILGVVLNKVSMRDRGGYYGKAYNQYGSY